MLKSLMMGSVSYSNLLRSPEKEGGAGAADDNPPVKDGAQAGADGGDGDGAGADGGDGSDGVAKASGDGADGDGDGADDGTVDDPPQPDWKTRELGRKHRQLQDSKRRMAELEEENRVLKTARQRQQQSDDGDDGAADPPARRAAPATDDAAVETRARQLAAETKFNDDCNTVASTGQKAYGARWSQAQANLAQLGGIDIQDMVRILATDDPSKVLYELGTNPDEFHRIMDLTPERRHTEMVKLAMKPSKKPPGRSKAPAPVDTVKSRSHTDPTAVTDDQDDDTWFQRRRAQKAAKWAKETGRNA